MTTVLLELVLLVGIPAAVYLVTCTQLSRATRARRLVALRLVGVAERTVATASAVEAGSAGALGAVLGLAAYLAVEPSVAESGVLGFRWYSADAGIGWSAATAFVVIVGLVCARLGKIGTRGSGRSLVVLRAEPDADSGSVWRLVPLLAGMGLLVPLVLGSLSSERRTSSDVTTALLVAGGALSTIGIVASVRPLTSAISRLLLRSGSLAARLAARRLLFEPGSAVRVTTGLVLLVLVAGIGNALLHEAALAAGPQGTTRTASVGGGAIPDADAREAVFRSAALGRVAVVGGTTGSSSAPGGGRATVVFGTCESFRAIVALDVPDCVARERYLVRDPDSPPEPGGLAVGMPVTLVASSVRVAATRTLDVRGLFLSPFGPNTVLVTAEDPPSGGWPTSVQFLFRFPADGDGVQEVRRTMSDLAPAAHLDVDGENIDAIEAYRLHRGIINFGLALGFLLGLLAFVVTAADRAFERRSNVAALLVVGVPSGLLRRTQVVQLLVPLAAVLGLAAAVSVLVGSAYVAAGGLESGPYFGGAAAALAMVGLSAAISTVAGVLVSGRRPGPEHVRRA